MKLYRISIIITLSFFFISCGTTTEQDAKDFSISTNAIKKVISNTETLTLAINNPKNHTIESVSYKINGKAISESIDLTSSKLGKQTIEATINYNGKTLVKTQDITLVNSAAPKVYTFKILNEYPHDITSYTQGLEFYNGELYEGTGQYGESKLRKVNYKTGEVIQNVDLAKEYFGEGITILNNTIYQLTWQRGVGFTYDLNTLERKGSFKYGKSKQGWGLCNDGKTLYKSDGTEKIWLLDPETLIEKDHIEVYRKKGKIININELEWINGKIYANSYQNNGVSIINPTNGALEAVINFSSLKDKVTQHPKLDVLNGIAYNPETSTIFVTGKNWDKLFEVEVIEN